VLEKHGRRVRRSEHSVRKHQEELLETKLIVNQVVGPRNLSLGNPRPTGRFPKGDAFFADRTPDRICVIFA
jgi:hypothetical protein